MISNQPNARPKLFTTERRQNTIITLGSKGSLAYDGTQFIYSPAFPAVVKIMARVTLQWRPLASGLAKGKLNNGIRIVRYASAHLPHLRLKRLMPSDMPENDSCSHIVFIGFTLQTTTILTTKSRSRL